MQMTNIQQEKPHVIAARFVRNTDEEGYGKIPEQTRNGLALYLEEGVEPGGFLKAVLSNDLMKAMDKADIENKKALPWLAMLLYNHVPAAAYGSPENVSRWILERNPEKIPTRIDSLSELQRTAQRFSDPDQIDRFMGEDAESTIRNIQEAVLNRIENHFAIAASDDMVSGLMTDPFTSGDMEDTAFSASSVLWKAIKNRIENEISDKVTAHVGKTLWVEEEETAGPGIG